MRNQKKNLGEGDVDVDREPLSANEESDKFDEEEEDEQENGGVRGRVYLDEKSSFQH